MWRQIVSLLVLSCNCWGFNFTPKLGHTRIVGGKEVDIKNAPFIVVIIIDERPLCGGSIISHNFILTVS